MHKEAIVNYIIAVFYSRSSTMNFASLLKNHNIPCAIINTPRKLQRACGISVKFLKDFFPKAQRLFYDKGYGKNFDGFYFEAQKNGYLEFEKY